MSESLKKITEKAALSAGTILLDYYSRPPENLETKLHAADYVSDADKAAENEIKEIIFKSFPEDSFVGEEGSDIAGLSEREWIVDPLDGTTNFLHGLDTWCVSIGIKEQGAVVAGVIYRPVTGELWSAFEGAALYNGQPLMRRPALGESISHGLTSVSGSLHPVEHRDRLLSIQAAAVGMPIRRMGTAALDLAWVAQGTLLMAYHEVSKLADWDVTAGIALCEAQGIPAGWIDPAGAGLPRRLLAGAENYQREWLARLGE